MYTPHDIQLHSLVIIYVCLQRSIYTFPIKLVVGTLLRQLNNAHKFLYKPFTIPVQVVCIS